ncbi:ABC transporter substrate-binding protein [Aquibacillus sp. 3ASR75-11]|uniref:Probable sugar-binding periplasmic protein n=1 Tax=Terrihalobacillus insolitus TaxID=2950438 RepID=A0A9X4AKV2_9BACI|nr:ABC transporter substrate-binding protein [Terrihalobacillus insolitus]MDC3412088.1 ABC transporter substrate-binding protein [Terrihalobacillus insolitus]MDC3423219.1 ABC transporter substrate-binding protein [Terrihalobacillus insolitus]
MKKELGIFLGLLLALTMVLAACSSGNSGESENGSGSSDNAEGSDNGDTTLEIFSWWTAGGEANALQALLDGFESANSDIKVENAAVAGGGGSNAKAVLATRMQGEDPPSTFQVHGGAELFQWLEADSMEPLDDLYEENGWTDIFPQKVIDMNTTDGSVYGVPIDIHRGNVLFYNKQIFDEYGIEPPKTFEDFFAAADTLQENGVTPLALGDKDPFGSSSLFETVLLGVLGPEDYSKLWTGELAFDSDGVREAAETFKKMLGYINDNHSSLAWQDADQLLVDGEAAMNVMGDWAEAYFVSKGWEPNKEFGWTATPGSQGSFMIVNDSFGLPKGVENPDDVKTFLTYLGSKEGQKAFNKLKGAIPARTDVDMSEFNEYSQSAMDDFKASDSDGTLTLSLANGSAASPGFLNKFNDAVNIFVTQQDVDQFINALTKASSQIK